MSTVSLRRALLLVPLLGPWGGLAAQQRVDRRIPIAPDASIRVLNLAGSIRVTGWDKDTLAVTGTLAPGAGKLFYFGGSGRGAKLGVDAAPGSEAGGRSNLEVWVPAKAKLWIKSATADLDVSGVTGGLDLYSVSGVIRVAGSPAQVSAESMDGNVEVSGDFSWVRLKTASGSVTLRGSGEDVSATSVSGSIAVQEGRYVRARFETVTGDIRFEGDIARNASLSFESHSGAIDLRLPSTVSADFEISQFQGEIVNELTRDQARPVRERGGQELAFTTGQGGADVAIRNFKGSVLLLKRK